MKALITGGAGFIGSHVADALIGQGHDVVVVDNLVSGKKENLTSKVKLYQEDVKHRPGLEAIFKKERPDVVLHFAAQKSVSYSAEHPAEDAAENILGSLNLMELAKQYGVKKFLFASTGGALYGEAGDTPSSETAPVRPESPYAIAKFATEQYLEFFRKSGAFKVSVLRMANVYGPRQDPKGEAGVVAIFCTRLLAGQPLTIYGDGQQTRDYVYVGDVARAFLLALEDKQELTVNIGSSTEASVLDLLAGLGQISGQAPKPNFEPSRAGELRRSCLDATLAKKLLGWQPTTSLQAGLISTYEWFRSDAR